MSTIVLDPGHGGHDSAGNSTPHGVRGPYGTLEKHVTLELARRISRQLGPNVVLTRDGDTNLSLAERVAVAARHGARVFLSLHTNASDAGDRGPEVFVHAAAGEPSLALARAVSHGLARVGAPHRDVLAADMAVLDPKRHAPHTAACLVEVDYLSSPDGEQRLRDPDVLDDLGRRIAGAVRQHLGAAHRRQDPPRQKTWAVIAGINDYSAAKAPPGYRWPRLGGCVNDANGVLDVLTRYYGAEPTVPLLDVDATRDHILDMLRGTIQGMQPTDALVFYFAGHGGMYQRTGADGQLVLHESIVPYDGNDIFDSDLAQALAQVPDGANVTVILDSCHSGGMGELANVPDNADGRPLPPYLELGPQSISVQPVGVCTLVAHPHLEPYRVQNSRLVSESRPNTTTVPYARATLFSAAEYFETASDLGTQGLYTTSLLTVLRDAPSYLSNQEVQRRVVEETTRRCNEAGIHLQSPMLRCQRTRLAELFAVPYNSSRFGLAAAR